MIQLSVLWSCKTNYSIASSWYHLVLTQFWFSQTAFRIKNWLKPSLKGSTTNLSLTQSSIWCVILYETLCLRAHSRPHWRKNPGVKPKELRSNPDVLMLVWLLMAAWVTNSMMELGRLYLFTMRMSWELSTFIPLTYEKRSLLELAFLYHILFWILG